MVGVDLRTYLRKACAEKRLEYVFKFTEHSINNIIEEDMYDLIITRRTVTLTLNGILRTSLEKYEESGYRHHLDLLIISHRRLCVFIPYKKWV